MKGFLVALIAIAGALLFAAFLGGGSLLPISSKRETESTGGGDAFESSTTSAFDDLMQGIFMFEGPGPRDRNNNPGNLKRGLNQIGNDSRGFAIFADIGDGWDALSNDLSYKLSKHPDWNFYDLFSYWLNGSTTAPTSTAEGNSKNYAEFVAGYMGVDPTTPVSEAIGG